MYKKIFVDQCGYLPEMMKKVTFASSGPVKFSVLRSDGSCIFKGEATEKVENAAAQEINYIGDFSAVEERGNFYITAEGLGESDIFAINKDVYLDAYIKSMQFFYLQRCGCDLSAKAAGEFAHPACHTTPAVVYGTSEKINVNGGWHDAGDYGRYVAPGAMAAAQLLLGYEANQTLAKLYVSPQKEDNCTAQNYLTRQQFEGDENNQTMPDYLDELKYEFDWMMKMQRADGALYHKVGCYNFCGFIMPQDEHEELVISPVSVTATADFAAACAMAVRFYKEYDKEYAAKLETVARKAYDALKTLDIPGGFKNPPEISTGEYGDDCDEDERYWAAAELYKAFGDTCYRADFEAIAAKKIYQGYGWVDMGSYGNIAYLSSGREIDSALKEKIEKEMCALADRLLFAVKADGYGTSLTKSEYSWGSNLAVANNGLHLMDAHRLTGDQKYLDAAREQIHYLFGRNPMGLCYLTGCGTDAVKRPHHRPSGFLGKAMPGMLSGGPCDWLADEVAKQVLQDAAPAKSLADMTGSYSTNEVTIYWNSALVQLLAEVL